MGGVDHGDGGGARGARRRACPAAAEPELGLRAAAG